MQEMQELPDSTNFYSSVRTDWQPEAIARLFARPVWRVRKCSRTDFEALSDFAEIVVESSNPVLIHGLVADVTVNGPRIVEPLAAAGLSGTFECYDAGGVLILEKAFSGSAGGG